MVIKRIINEYRKQIYAHKCDKLDEMDQLFKRHGLPKFTQEETDHLNISITSTEIQFVIKVTSRKQKFRTGQFYRGILPNI